MEQIEAFAEKLLEETGMTKENPALYEQMKKDLEERIEDVLKRAIIENMPEEKYEEFEAVLKSSDVETQKFIAANIPDLENVIAKELLEFRSSYLNK